MKGGLDSYYWVPAEMPYIRFTILTFPVVIGSAFLLLDTVVCTASSAVQHGFGSTAL